MAARVSNVVQPMEVHPEAAPRLEDGERHRRWRGVVGGVWVGVVCGWGWGRAPGEGEPGAAAKEGEGAHELGAPRQPVAGRHVVRLPVRPWGRGGEAGPGPGWSKASGYFFLGLIGKSDFLIVSNAMAGV